MVQRAETKSDGETVSAQSAMRWLDGSGAGCSDLQPAPMKPSGKLTRPRLAIDRRRWMQMAATFAISGAVLRWAIANNSSQVSVLALENGIRILAIEFPASAHVSIFSFLPLGLTSDGPGQAQWSHLVEHLVIRSTIPEQTATANFSRAFPGRWRHSPTSVPGRRSCKSRC
jgi:hypothetical protein